MSFEALTSRAELRGILECVTPMHLGSFGDTQPGALPEGALLRDVLDRPYVPGSSLRGCLRAALESILRGVETSLACDPSAAGCRLPAAGGPAPCPVCDLFGCPGLASRVAVLDAPVQDPWEPWMTGARATAAIDRESETALRSGRREFETIPAGARFAFELRLENPQDDPLHHLGLVFTALDLLDNGYATLGGRRATGLGRVSVRLESLALNTARSYLGLERPRGLAADGLPAYAEACRKRVREQLAARLGEKEA
jgi:CRISPR/Cas system CSM-associated protein Csm3 (group 7 of RAMP superfamily)